MKAVKLTKVGFSTFLPWLQSWPMNKQQINPHYIRSKSTHKFLIITYYF